MGLLAVLGVILIVFGIIALFGVISLSLPIAIVLVVVGILLVVFGGRVNLNRQIMPSVSDDIMTKLRGLGYVGSINDMLREYWKATAVGEPASMTSCNDFRRYNKTLADGLVSKFPTDALP